MKRQLLLLFALVPAVPLAAPAQQPMHQQPMHQQPGPDHMAMMHEMMAPMMRVMAFTPEHLLARRDSLGLTAQQVARLTALRDAAKSAHDAAHADAKAHRDELLKGMAAAAPDTAGARRHFQAAHAAMGNAHWTMLRAAALAKAVLTDAQRANVEAWAGTMEHRRP